MLKGFGGLQQSHWPTPWIFRRTRPLQVFKGPAGAPFPLVFQIAAAAG